MVIKMKLKGKNYEMKVLKNEKRDLVLFADFSKMKGILMNEKSVGRMYDIDIQYNNGMISKIRLV